MGLLTRLFGRKQSEKASDEADKARWARMPSGGDVQTAEEKQATRERMEAEMAAQRARRSPAPTAEA